MKKQSQVQHLNIKKSRMGGLVSQVTEYRLTSFLLALLLSVFVYLFSKEPIYLKNDYGFILNTLSGGLTGAPYHNVFFVSPALGKIIALLYSATNGFFPWLSVFCYLFYLAGLYLLVRTVLKYVENHWLKLGYVILLAVFFQAFGTFLNVFLLSLYLFASVLIYLFFAASYEKRIPDIKLILAGFLFAFAYFFRPIFWNFMLLFAVPLVIILILNKKTKNLLLILFAFLILFIPETIISNRLNRSYDHQAFYEYSFARSDLMDTNRGKLEGADRDAGQDAAGWSENDLKMLQNWQLVDETVFNTQSCQAYMDSGGKGYINLNGLKDIYRSSEPKFFLTLCFGAFLLALFTKAKKPPVIQFDKEKRDWLFLLLPLYYFGGTFLLFAIRFNVNMMFAMFLLVFFTIPFSFSVFNRNGLIINKPKKNSRKILNRMMKVLIGIGAVFFILIFNRYALNGHMNNLNKMRYYFGKPFLPAERYNTQIEFLDEHVEAPYIILPSSVMSDFPMVYTCMPFLEYKNFKPSDWVPVAWRAQSEYFYKIINQHGYQSGSDLLRSLAEGDTSIIIFSAGSDDKIAAEKEMLYTFLSEHYGDSLASSKADFIRIYKDDYAELSVLASPDSNFKLKP